MMTLTGGAPGDREARRRILRRASLFTLGFSLAAIAVAVAGSALVAWFLSITGLPFRATWLSLSGFVLAVPLAGQLVGAVRERRRGSGGQGTQG